jgi:hypothetical protein
MVWHLFYLNLHLYQILMLFINILINLTKQNSKILKHKDPWKLIENYINPSI